jgi:peptidoglycan hydrolase-like protein with peptidoglycan-binding domain
MSDELERRADDLSRDDNLDLEDVRFVLAAATPEQRAEAASALLAARAAALEPAARRYLDAIAANGANGADAAARAPNRLLLAPAPRGRAKDLYYPRTDVVALQEALTRVGERLAVDGDYGPATARAVASTQTRLGLSATGTVDSNTLLALNGALAAAGLATLDLTPRARIRPDWVLACRGAAASEDALTLRAALRCLATHFNDEALAVEESGPFDAALESAIRHLQAQAYLPETGIVDLSTLDALNAALLAAGQSAVQLAAPRAPAAGPIELHFYPGEHELEVYVLRGGALLDSYAMVGGRAEAKPDPNNPVVSYDPTPAGRYEVIGLSPHASGSWAYSYVPYGSELREQDGEIAFRDGQRRVASRHGGKERVRRACRGSPRSQRVPRRGRRRDEGLARQRLRPHPRPAAQPRHGTDADAHDPRDALERGDRGVLHGHRNAPRSRDRPRRAALLPRLRAHPPEGPRRDDQPRLPRAGHRLRGPRLRRDVLAGGLAVVASGPWKNPPTSPSPPSAPIAPASSRRSPTT